MRVTAWNNGSHQRSGTGYGLKIGLIDRDENFDRNWKSVFLLLPDSNQPLELNIDKKSFWSSSCRELIHKEIGLWLINSGLAPWPKGHPPKFTLINLQGANFRLIS